MSCSEISTKNGMSFHHKLYIQQLFLEPEWVLSQQPMRPKAEWTIDAEARRVRGIIVLVKSKQLVKNIETKQLQLAKRDSTAVGLVFKAGAFSLLVGYNIQPRSSSTNQNAALIIDHQLDLTKYISNCVVLFCVVTISDVICASWPRLCTREDITI